MVMFRKKPVVILANYFDGTVTSAHIIRAWSGEKIGIKVENSHSTGNKNVTLKINTLEGPMLAVEGDVIIKGVEGEFYPCKGRIFLKTYEPCPEHPDAIRVWQDIQADHSIDD